MNENTYKPRDTRLQNSFDPAPLIRRWLITLGVIGLIILLFVDADKDGPLHRLYTRPSVIAEHVLPNGETLVIHGVLRNGVDSMQLRGEKVSGRFKFGLTLVISCENPETGLSSDWKWFNHFELEDRYGAVVRGHVDNVIYRTADGELESHSSDMIESMSSPEVYYVVHFPEVETVKPCEFLAIGNDDEVWARVESPFPPPEPIQGFYDHSHDLTAESGPWKVELSRIVTYWNSTHRGPDSSNLANTEFLFEHEGQPLQKEHVLKLDGKFSDAVGNPVALYIELNKQPLWKYSMKVARMDYPTTKQAKELISIGRISEPSESSELVIADTKVLKIQSASYLPEGKHEKIVQTLDQGDESLCDFSKSHSFGWQRLFRSSASGGLSGHNATRGSHTEADFELRPSKKVLHLDLTSQTNQPARLRIDTKLPLVIFELAEPLNDRLINLFAFDQLNRALQVNTVQSGLEELPMFIVELESDTKQIDLFYSIEPIVPLEFYMIPPLKDVVLLDSGSTWFWMTGEKDGWTVKQQHEPEK